MAELSTDQILRLESLIQANQATHGATAEKVVERAKAYEAYLRSEPKKVWAAHFEIGLEPMLILVDEKTAQDNAEVYPDYIYFFEEN